MPSGAIKGHKVSKETREKIRKGNLGYIHHSTRGENNWNWSKKPSYRAIHKWLYRTYGRPYKCESKAHDYSKYVKVFDWALKRRYNHERKRNNYKMLCRSCHIRYDSK